jgi:hypothetical protein
MTVANSVTFTVNIYDSCDDVLITKSPITTPQSYDILSGNAMELAILSWTQDLSYCSSITYSIVDSSGNTADSIFYISNNDVFVNTA